MSCVCGVWLLYRPVDTLDVLVGKIQSGERQRQPDGFNECHDAEIGGGSFDVVVVVVVVIVVVAA